MNVFDVDEKKVGITEVLSWQDQLLKILGNISQLSTCFGAPKISIFFKIYKVATGDFPDWTIQ